MMFGMGLFWILVIVVVVYLIKDQNVINATPPERTLDERLARGEIDKDTYYELRRTLRENRR